MGRLVTGFLSRCSPENKGRIGARAWLLFSPPRLTATGRRDKNKSMAAERDESRSKDSQARPPNLQMSQRKILILCYRFEVTRNFPIL